MKRTLKERGEITKFYEAHGIRETMYAYKLTKCQVKEVARWYRKRRKKKAKMLSPEQIIAFRSKCYAYMAKTKWYDQADDFASWACVMVLEGRIAKIEILYKGFIKHLFRLDRKGDCKNEFFGESLTHEDSGGDKFQDDTLTQDKLLELDYIHRTFIELGVKDQKTISILILRFIYGFEEKDIGIIFMLAANTIDSICNDFLEKARDKSDGCL